MSKVVTLDGNTTVDAVQTQAGEDLRLLLGRGNGSIEVQWDTEAKVTPSGSLVFFVQYLESAGLFEGLCDDCPIKYRSNNAPKVRDVWGTILLSILNGQTRYAHISGLRGERVGMELLGMSKVVSEDSIRRALGKGSEEEWNTWLGKQERAVYEPLLAEDYVLDIDNTVKPLYGHQEGAEQGYNPQKPGRPSHNYHTYFIGSLRLVLGTEVMPGKQHAGCHSLPGLWRIVDSLPPRCRPSLLRGDIGYGNEGSMSEAEARGLEYLFRLKRTKKVKELVGVLERASGAWSDAGNGWQGTESRLRLSGWSRERRCVLLRRPAERGIPPAKVLPEKSGEFNFCETFKTGPDYEYCILVTSCDLPICALGKLYRDRADCENVFDEIKNQWGWGGYVTQDLKRCRIIARLVAIIYNWWNIFARLANPGQHMEAITSRPLLLQAVGRLVISGRIRTLRLTPSHAASEQIQLAFSRISTFLNQLYQTAEQLSAQERWRHILSAAFIKWLKGRVLAPIYDGSQILMP